MKIKKYIAPTMPEAMSKIRKELGNDAVILNSKVIQTGGIFGLFKKKNIEVIAAIDPDITKQEYFAEPKKEVNASPAKPVFYKTEQTNEQKLVLDEVRSLRKWVEENNASQQIGSFPQNYESVYTSLVEQDVDASLAKDIVSKVREQFSEEELTVDQIKQHIRTDIQAELNRIGCGGITYDKQFIHLVGPTGVGKTTTIAKIAANAMLKDKKSVALITTDTYRIAAIEQLKTYSKILDVPIEIVYNLTDYKTAKEKFKDYDLVLVDTAGRNFRDPKYVQELGKVVDLEHDIDTYLVLSLTTKSNDLVSIYQQFNQIPLKGIIFTKSDETVTYGSMLNLSLPNEVGIAYMTTGQDVPDDILEVTANNITQLVVGANENV
ncbi:flagellar biosynthesis protein FlhF [Paraliobacillus salinarum]|uniref:flagellar biosynthesis protein FlhF n=1 Tax=Paraliobacillus salinarum TaxID=1158996 RepID=UPI0015F3CE9E|nr:flagellar biosynthesis protein FlhF [Paraliobacillus salinarum]